MRLGLRFLVLGVCCHVLAVAMPTAQAAITSATHTATSGLITTPDNPTIVLGSFGAGSTAINDRTHTVKPGLYDININPLGLPPTPWIVLGNAGGTVSPFPFPSYLTGGDQVKVNNNNRTAVDYQLTTTVDAPSNVYLLIDNRVGAPMSAGGPKFEGGNSFLNSYFEPDVTSANSPVLWVSADGWQRVNTGITPGGLPDYVGIDEGNNGDLNQYYSVFTKFVPAGGSVITRGQPGGNMYTIVAVPGIPEPNSLLLMSIAGIGLAARRRWMR